MNLEKYTERVRGFIQSAQTMALSRNHQQFTPEHLLKVLIDDDEGFGASLIERAGGRPRDVKLGVEAALEALPRVEGGNGQLYLGAAARQGVHHRRGDWPRRPATASSPSSACCRRWRWRSRPRPPKSWPKAGVTPQALNQVINDIRKGRTADSASAEQAYDALKKYARDLTADARAGKLDPVIGRDEEIRRTIQVLSRRTKNNPVLIGEPGVGKTAIVEGLALAHRQWRRAGDAEGQAADGARHGRPDRRREISRRVRGAAEGGAVRSHRRPAAASSCSSTRCTRWSAPARPTARWTRRTC